MAVADLARALEGDGWKVLEDPDQVPANTSEFVTIDLAGAEVTGGRTLWGYAVTFYASSRSSIQYKAGDHQAAVEQLISALRAEAAVFLESVEPTDYATDRGNLEWAVTTVLVRGN